MDILCLLAALICTAKGIREPDNDAAVPWLAVGTVLASTSIILGGMA